MFAALNGQVRAVELLISSSADLEARDNNGRTALMWGATNDKVEVIVPLLGHTSEVDTRDNEGETALIVAAWYGCTSAVKALLKKGADVNATTNTHENHWALRCRISVFRLFRPRRDRLANGELKTTNYLRLRLHAQESINLPTIPQ